MRWGIWASSGHRRTFCPFYVHGESYGGFPSVCCPGVLAFAHRWGELEIDWSAQRVLNHSRDSARVFEPMTAVELPTIEAGGFVNYLIRRRTEEISNRG